MPIAFRLLLAAGLSVAARAPAAAPQAHPDFAGTWVMDTTRSNRDGVLKSLTLTVDRVGDTLSVRTEGANAAGTFATSARYVFDGESWPNMMGGATVATVMTWDGSTLVFTSSGDAGGLSNIIIPVATFVARSVH